MKTISHTIKVSQNKTKLIKQILPYLENSLNDSSAKQLEQVLANLSPKIIDSNDSQTNEQIKKIFEADYSEGNLAILELINLEQQYQSRRKLLANSITTPEVVKLIGCQAVTTVHDRRKAGTLLGLKDNGVYKFPLWQFDPQGDDGIIDRLPEIIKALQVSDFAKLNWFNKPLTAFENQTPIKILRTKNSETIDELLVEARGVGVAQ